MTGKGYDQISTPRRIGNAELDSSSTKADRPNGTGGRRGSENLGC